MFLVLSNQFEITIIRNCNHSTSVAKSYAVKQEINLIWFLVL